MGVGILVLVCVASHCSKVESRKNVIYCSHTRPLAGLSTRVRFRRRHRGCIHTPKGTLNCCNSPRTSTGFPQQLCLCWVSSPRKRYWYMSKSSSIVTYWPTKSDSELTGVTPAIRDICHVSTARGAIRVVASRGWVQAFESA